MSNFLETIQQVEASISQTEEFQQLKGAVEVVRNDDEARTIFTQFRDTQLKLQQMQMQGEELQEEELFYLQKVFQLAEANPKITALFEAEMALSRLIDELNRSLIKPIQSIYEGL